jgi:hypothetical protein
MVREENEQAEPEPFTPAAEPLVPAAEPLTPAPKPKALCDTPPQGSQLVPRELPCTPPTAGPAAVAAPKKQGKGLAETLAMHAAGKERPEPKAIRPKTQVDAGSKCSLPKDSKDFEGWLQDRIASLAVMPARKGPTREQAAASRAAQGTQDQPRAQKKRKAKKGGAKAPPPAAPAPLPAPAHPPPARSAPSKAGKPAPKGKGQRQPDPVPEAGLDANEEAPPTRTRKAIYSSAYHRAKSAAVGRGISLDRAKELAREAAQAAVSSM